jgi:hypothetical protein
MARILNQENQPSKVFNDEKILSNIATLVFGLIDVVRFD